MNLDPLGRLRSPGASDDTLKLQIMLSIYETIDAGFGRRLEV